MKPYFFLSVTLISFNTNADTYRAPQTPAAIAIDGVASDPGWENAEWKAIEHLTLGEHPVQSDFQGRFKAVWNSAELFVLAEIMDDVLIDTHANPLDRYWEDDCLEVFIDEDASGGNHQFSHNAFAYHVALDNQVVDIGPFRSESDKAAGIVNFQLYNEHIRSRWQRSQNPPYPVIWELAIRVYSDTFENSRTSQPVTLAVGKEMGFMLAYCDSDSTAGRESFMSSENISPINGDRNRGYIDASVFGRIILDN